MKLTHICPICNREHELDSVPEPPQPCPRCKDFQKLIDLVRNQFEYGGQKYALDEERESTDVLFDKHGKNWLFGTIDKYTFRYKNLGRERDLLKIACYMYILWLKRGFHVIKTGVNDPPLDTNIQQKQQHFNTFVEKARNYELYREKNPFFVFFRGEQNQISLIESISKQLQECSQKNWVDIPENTLLFIFDNAFLAWQTKYAGVANHDTDTYLKKKETKNEKSKRRKR